MSGRRRVKKALVYLTRGGGLLVFRQPQYPEAGVQVPGGTVDPGEDVAVAAARELAEETGLERGVRLVRHLGVVEVDMAPEREEVQERHFFHFVEEGLAPERWTHWERFCSDGEGPIELELFWVPLDGTD